MKFNKRVYGVVGIKSIMSNWNADFTGRPKTITTGEIFGSDKAFKYPIKKYWENQGEKILYMKSYQINKDKLQPKQLSERYQEIFGTAINDKTPSKEVLSNLFSAIDVLNFGATFAEKKQNISITGAVQIGQGFNKYKDVEIETQDILSPFRNSTKEDADASSLGKKIVVDEAHYMYPFSINPKNYDVFKDVIDNFEGYTEDAYKKFKKGCLVAATGFNTNSKSGSENEFAIFIEVKEEEQLYLANLDSYISFIKNTGDKDIIDITELKEMLRKIEDKIHNIEIYYNTHTVQIDTTGLKCNAYDIFDEVK
ncbi:type I CRISPR-associated protein Cas7 [Alkalibaculum bacchi]|uniref:type I CRISPR-associated protein Cas7 n=1 Tax=Alkalibaculum bacchi TaxID=645887 RepID=UPI0026F18C75|nr:type I CRISPR-associated protein Cas7 [Alkalibaculum bacchi]